MAQELLQGIEAKLLFRASRDGFTWIKFHEHCDGKGNALTIIKATTGRIFGDLRSVAVPKEGERNNYIKDEHAFLFQDNDAKKFSVKRDQI